MWLVATAHRLCAALRLADVDRTACHRSPVHVGQGEEVGRTLQTGQFRDAEHSRCGFQRDARDGVRGDKCVVLVGKRDRCRLSGPSRRDAQVTHGCRTILREWSNDVAAADVLDGPLAVAGGGDQGNLSERFGLRIGDRLEPQGSERAECSTDAQYCHDGNDQQCVLLRRFGRVWLGQRLAADGGLAGVCQVRADAHGYSVLLMD